MIFRLPPLFSTETVPMRLVLTVLFLLFAFSATALAHESHKGFKYESYCCNGDAETGDCQMIPTRSVRVTSDGYEVSLAPGRSPHGHATSRFQLVPESGASIRRRRVPPLSVSG